MEQMLALWSRLEKGVQNWSSFIQPIAQADVLRLDQLHPLISGNKALKLYGWWQTYAREREERTWLTFGGAHSNHLHASAAFAQAMGISLVCVVRGYDEAPRTSTLLDCEAMGATLVFADKKTYARRYDSDFQQELAERYQALVIGEGGRGEWGELGCEALASACQGYDQVWLAVGSGTTALGLAKGLAKQGCRSEVVGVNVVSDQGAMLQHFKDEMPPRVPWQLIEGAFGGFGKVPQAVREALERYDALGLPLDPVYTAKLFLAYEQQHDATKRVLLIHSGGLQGRRALSL